jgi:hypothetical protein
MHRWLQDRYEFCKWINMPVGQKRSEWSSYNSQVTRGVEIAVPLCVNIPCTSGRGSDLHFKAVLQEHLQFS